MYKTQKGLLVAETTVGSRLSLDLKKHMDSVLKSSALEAIFRGEMDPIWRSTVRRESGCSELGVTIMLKRRNTSIHTGI